VAIFFQKANKCRRFFFLFESEAAQVVDLKECDQLEKSASATLLHERHMQRKLDCLEIGFESDPPNGWVCLPTSIFNTAYGPTGAQTEIVFRLGSGSLPTIPSAQGKLKLHLHLLLFFSICGFPLGLLSHISPVALCFVVFHVFALPFTLPLVFDPDEPAHSPKDECEKYLRSKFSEIDPRTRCRLWFFLLPTALMLDIVLLLLWAVATLLLSLGECMVVWSQNLNYRFSLYEYTYTQCYVFLCIISDAMHWVVWWATSVAMYAAYCTRLVLRNAQSNRH
jgi:hypothetical protein